MNFAIALIALVLIVASVTSMSSAQQAPFFREDLRPFGFLTNGSFIGSYTDISFLSNDLLLVTVNQLDFHGARIATYPLGDQPPSKVLLFSVSQKALLRSKDMPVEKAENSVRAIAGEKFVLLDQSGLRICTSDLECGSLVSTTGPVLVSPGRTRLAVGGNISSDQLLLDAASLRVLEHFPPKDQLIVAPGDNGLLVRQRGKVYLRLVGQPDRQLSFACCAFQPPVSFLNDTTIAGFESNKAFAVEKTDGTVLFRIPLRASGSGDVEVQPAPAGARFCLQEMGWTRWNSAANLGFDEGRDFNSETVEVLSADSGKVLFELHGNPRPYIGHLTTPALAPNGRRLALIHHGFLEVYEIP